VNFASFPWRSSQAAWIGYIMVSFISMAFGFYDLYKNVPYVKAFVSAALSR